jgi:acetyl esterase/lipase
MTGSTPEVIARATERDLGIDIFWPDSDEKAAAVVLLHGGGWMAGHRSDMHKYAKILRREGFLAICAEYRLTGEAPWPAQILDVKDIIRWVRRNADWLHINPEKIALQGFSAGAHLALLAAATADRAGFGAAEPHADGSAAVAAVVSFFGPPDFSRELSPVRVPPIASLFGAEGNEDVALEASPQHHIRQGFPPTFLLSGMADPIIHYQRILDFFSALAAVDTKVDLHLYHGHSHEFAALPSMIEAVQAEVALFLSRAVVDPQFYHDENLALNMFSRPPPPR